MREMKEFVQESATGGRKLMFNTEYTYTRVYMPFSRTQLTDVGSASKDISEILAIPEGTALTQIKPSGYTPPK